MGQICKGGRHETNCIIQFYGPSVLSKLSKGHEKTIAY
jgi:hypothetical protein